MIPRLQDFKKRIRDYIDQFDTDKFSLELYENVICSVELNENQLKDILCWKIRGRLTYDQLSHNHRKLIDRAIGKLIQINSFKHNKISQEEFDPVLHHISPNGCIVRIFILHICKPEEYPIFDQHVYRAFRFIKRGEIYLGTVTSLIAKNDYSNYGKFFGELCQQLSLKFSRKEIDSALMVYGKELKKRKKRKLQSTF